VPLLGLPDRVLSYEPDKGIPSDEDLEKALKEVELTEWEFVRDSIGKLNQLKEEEALDFSSNKDIQPESFTIFSMAFQVYERLQLDIQQLLKRCVVESADKVINEIASRLRTFLSSSLSLSLYLVEAHFILLFQLGF